MNVRQADPDYVKAITEDPVLDTIFVHQPRAGMGISVKKR